MRHISYTCDGCGKKIEDGYYELILSHADADGPNLLEVDGKKLYNRQFCADCMRSIIDSIVSIKAQLEPAIETNEPNFNG